MYVIGGVILISQDQQFRSQGVLTISRVKLLKMLFETYKSSQPIFELKEWVNSY